jgi:dihydrodipicolinate synthase/N-acetylneuraminate lyase
MKSEERLHGGVVAAAITPRRAHEHSIDLAATLELIDFLSDGGVDGIALLGSTGEFIHFVPEDRIRMLEFAVKRSRRPILVNVSHSTLDGAVQIAQQAADAGVAGVLLMPPYYFQYTQEALRTFYLEFASEIGTSLPIYLYNIPSFTSALALETAVELLATGLFAGIKDSGGTWEYFTGLHAQKQRQDFTLFTGNDRLFHRSRQAGSDGIVSGVACAVPELLIRLDRALQKGETVVAEALDLRLREFLDWFDCFPVPVGIKEAARLRKVKAGELGVPLGPSECASLIAFQAWFKNWLPQVLKECK